MKKLLSALVIVLMLCSMAACGGKSSNKEIPDVFGVNYADAITILESEGFTVNAIETSVESFSIKLLYPLETVEKGAVFKIDDYIIDNNGNLNKNYDVFYKDGLISDDMSLVIYYAKEDYTLEKENVSNTTSPSTEASKETTKEPTEEPSEEVTSAPIEPSTEAPTEAPTEAGLRPDFKAAMDSYETFMDEYITFMKKYKKNPNDLGLIMQYATFMGEYSEFVEDFEKWNSEDLNDAELAYYLEVQARVTKKLTEIA